MSSRRGTHLSRGEAQNHIHTWNTYSRAHTNAHARTHTRTHRGDTYLRQSQRCGDVHVRGRVLHA